MTRARWFGWMTVWGMGLGATVAPAQVAPVGATVTLALSADRGPSALGADLATLAAGLCGGPSVRMPGGSEDCRLVAGDKRLGDPDSLVIRVLPSHLGVATVLLQPVSAYLQGEVVTSCGTWTWQLGLDPTRRQVSSPLELLALPGDPASGTTRGVLSLAARVDFTHELGETVAMPWRVDLDFLARYRFRRWPTSDLSDLELLFDGTGLERTQCVSERTHRCGKWCLAVAELGPS